MPRIVCWLLVLTRSLAGMGLALAQGPLPQAQQVDIATELERLMSLNGFAVRGIDQVQDVRGHAGGEGLLARLHLLLEDFDHVIVQKPDGAIDRVIILGAKAAYVPPPMVVEEDAAQPVDGPDAAAGAIVLPTQRKGASHTVTLSLEGVADQKIQTSLLIDTGADRVVLPVSTLSALGMSPGMLQTRPVQTANGPVDAMVGTLTAIWLGETRVADVGVAFIDDQLLGGNSLLGMSLLGRYRMTIDDEKSQLTLISR